MSGTSPPSRRLFVKRVLTEAFSLADEMHGRPQRRLSDLPSVPADNLAKLKGTVRRDVELTVSGDVLQLVTRGADGSSTCTPVLECTPGNLAVYRRINGPQTLGEIADQVAREMDWDRERAWRHVSEVFLALVAKGVCLPANVVD